MKLFSILIVATLLCSQGAFANQETQKNNKKLFGFLKKWKENKKDKKELKKKLKMPKIQNTPFMQELDAWNAIEGDDPVASRGRCGVLNWQVAYIIIHLDAKGENHLLVWNNLKSSIVTDHSAKPMSSAEIAKVKLINENPADAFSEFGEYTNHVMSKDLAVQLMIEADKRGLCK